MKFLIALAVVTGVAVGCSPKADVGDAEVKIPKGTAKTPGAPTMGGGHAVAPGPAPKATTPEIPK